MGRTIAPVHKQKAYFLINVKDVKHMDDLKGAKKRIKKKSNVQEIINKINDSLAKLKNELTQLENML